ncbi:MAG: valine--tRNA ligase [Thermodesulfobacteriota bacterium]|nr:valine--tRNA ligase [Thermodesulfobacteriota bacterium]
MKKEYDPGEIEQRWYASWSEKGLFHAEADSRARGSYSMVIPPPNVTGVLHMGHAMNNTLQDILIRFNRMEGLNTLWVPGTDHAGIATQNVVEKDLAKRGITRHDMGRDAFVEEVWKWRRLHGDKIIDQLKRMGSSCDWERLRFTMDKGLSKAVRKVFVSLYEEGLIYRSDYIVNWCPRCHSALSDLEVEHEDEDGFLWHMRYPLADGSGEVVVATTRPETMLGDTAVAVHPGDERYASMIGKKCILPFVDRQIPIIEDAVVDVEFGTGAVKITPAHDLNDYEMGIRHGLERIVIMDTSGVMNENAGPYKGMDRFECRRVLEHDLDAGGFLVDKTQYTVPVGHCYRCKSAIEPYLSKQWFVRVKPMAEDAIMAVKEGKTRILPAQWEKTYFEWMNNIRDWCISRQIWWGHRIPAWFCDECGEITVAQADPKVCAHCGSANIHQDSDVLDTWFSSALWPFSTMGWPENTPELKTFYPTSVIITGFDILFFWVARMMMMGIKFMGDVPFRDVYLHALVRDEHGHKMSKSKGNVVDPMDVMDHYGADAFRFTLTAFAAMGRDVRISDKRIQGYRFFINKIWNAGKYVLNKIEGFDPDSVDCSSLRFSLADQWILYRLNHTIHDTREALKGYRYNEAAETLYQFTWHTLCDWYIELSKNMLEGEEKIPTMWTLYYTLKTSLELLHPIIPFVTEEIWQEIPGKKEASIMVAPYPEVTDAFAFADQAKAMAFIIEAIGKIRSIRGETGISPKARIDVVLRSNDHKRQSLFKANETYIRELAVTQNITFIPMDDPRPPRSALAVVSGMEIYVLLEGVLDIATEIARLDKQITKTTKELEKKKKKLANQNFLDKAKEEVVDEQRRLNDELESKLGKLKTAADLLKD